MTSYKNDNKPIEALKQDDYDCTTMARTLQAAQRANLSHNPDALLLLDVLNLTFSRIPNEIEMERFICLQSRGWTPIIQFVNTNYLKSSDNFMIEFNYCKKQLADDELLDSVVNNISLMEKILEDDESVEIEKREKMGKFAECLIQNGWWLVTQEPWYINSQKLENIIRLIPRGKWQPISKDDKKVFYYDPGKIVREVGKLRLTILTAPIDPSDPKTGLFSIEFNCKEKAYRESISPRKLKDKAIQPIPQKSHAEVIYTKLCM